MKDEILLDEIKELIPHRDPFLFLDKLFNIEKLTSATGYKIFDRNESFFKGHFPEKAVVPGVILIEMMAQTAAALIAYSIKEETFDKIVYLMNIGETKFRKPVFPEDEVFAYVKATRSRGRVWKFMGIAKDKDQNIIAESTWSATIMDKD
jgi:3-hydroxyacyl-[acyl-carrier-protein] dehydratase|tara:strand:+ start:78 stop:527 length:450 start_codon:yes stop_codon:yes gene_type:complete